MATLSTFFDMVYVQVSGSPGSGNATLGSALIGFQTPAAAGITNGTHVSYRMTDGTNWETAHGTIDVSGSTYTLVRGVDTIHSNNSNALVNFTASSGITVLICPLSQDMNAWVSAGAAQSFTTTQQAQAQSNLGFARTTENWTFANTTITCSLDTNSYMLGAGNTYAYTPKGTGIVLLLGTSFATISSGGASNDIIRTWLYYGTGTAPSNGAVASGTQFGLLQSFHYSTSLVQANVPILAILSLSPGTPYWFDLGMQDGSTSSVVLALNSNTLSLFEF
jgi:hypothetical protein